MHPEKKYLAEQDWAAADDDSDYPASLDDVDLPEEDGADDVEDLGPVA